MGVVNITLYVLPSVAQLAQLFIYLFSCCPYGSRMSERCESPILLDLILRDKNSLVAGMLTVIRYVMDNHNNLNFFDGIVKTNAELSVEPPPLDVSDMSSSSV